MILQGLTMPDDPTVTSLLLSTFLPQRLSRSVRRIVHVDLATSEDLAQEIWLLCWTKKILPSRTLIRNRCYDWLRSRTCELSANEHRVTAGTPPETGLPSHDIQWVNNLIETSGLTQTERMVVWKKFWKGQSDESIGQDMALAHSRVVEILTSAKNKLYINYLKGQEQ